MRYSEEQMWTIAEREIWHMSSILYDKHGYNVKVETNVYIECPTGSFRIVAEPVDKMIDPKKKEVLWCDR